MSDAFRDELQAAHGRLAELEARLQGSEGAAPEADVVGPRWLALEDDWRRARDRFGRRSERGSK